jgi:ATP-dependent protease ClpP protease subunit
MTGNPDVIKALQAAAAAQPPHKRPPTSIAAARPRFQASILPDGTLEMLIYGDIVDAATISMLESWGCSTEGLISATAIKKQMDSAGGYTKIALRVNSPGGDAFEGIAIHSLMRSQGKPVAVFVDGVAASSASVVAMAGDTITMGPSSMMMIHNAWSDCRGYGSDMRKMADTLDKVSEAIGQAYVDRTGQTTAEIRALMDAETWMSSQDCLRDGFCTEISQAEEPEAMALAQRFRARFQAKAKCECSCENCAASNCDACTNADCADKNCKDCPMQEGASAESDLSLYEARISMLGRPS